MPHRPHRTSHRRLALHEGFLRHAGGRWARISGLIALLAVVVYLADDPTPHAAGDTVYGYVLGVIATLLILWLAALGIRKRTHGRTPLKAWTSAHVWLGLALVVIATLHTGFEFGWNVHTLAYALMLLVVVSGLFGVAVYALVPERVAANRGERTERQMLDELRAIDRQLTLAAQPLGGAAIDLVRASLDENPFARGLWHRLVATEPYGPTAEARHAIGAIGGQDRAAVARVIALLSEKQASIARIHRHLHLRALLEIWLYLHIPATIALIAAVIAHIVAVFFYG